ncbi:MAG: DUF4232 domain-containing protein [Acidimicrobiales bacterium]
MTTVVATSSTTSTTEAPTSTTVSATTTTVAAAGPERCTAANVQIRQTDSRAALGQSLAVFEVRNTGNRPCRVTGYPRVDVVDAAKSVLASASTKPGALIRSGAPTTVTVAPRATAYFGVQSQSICPDDQPDVEGAGARVTLPDDTAAVEVVATIAVCPQPEIVVSPIRRSPAEVAA